MKVGRPIGLVVGACVTDDVRLNVANIMRPRRNGLLMRMLLAGCADGGRRSAARPQDPRGVIMPSTNQSDTTEQLWAALCILVLEFMFMN